MVRCEMCFWKILFLTAFCSARLKYMQKLSSCRFPAQSPAMMQACGRKAGQALKNQQVFLPDLILINGL